MKKLLVLFLSFTVFAACSKDDDDNTQNETDPIIGTWLLADASSPINLLFCEDEQSTITFNADNTGETTFFLNQNDCEAENSSGEWSNNGNSAYRIELPGIGDLNGTANFSGNESFTFTTNGGTLTFERQQ